MGIPILIVVWDTPQAKFFVETGIIFVTSLAFLLLIYVPKVMASITDRKNAIAEEKKKAYSSFIENRAKRENDFDDDGDGDGGKDDADSYSGELAANSNETTDDTGNEKAEPVVEPRKDESPDSSNGPAKRPSRLMMFGGAMKLDEQSDGTTGLKIIHNPRVSTTFLFCQSVIFFFARCLI